jgi:DNA-binding response OmpR family regulator
MQFQQGADNMGTDAIYLRSKTDPDPVIVRALEKAGCGIQFTDNPAQTFNALRSRMDIDAGADRNGVVLIAEVQAGAILLLSLLHEERFPLPPTLLLDRNGHEVVTAIQALKLGANDYILASESELQRELRVRVLAERAQSVQEKRVTRETRQRVADHEQAKPRTADFEWLSESNIIRYGDSVIRLSPVEGRLFGMLLAKREHTVTLEELIGSALQMPGKSVDSGVRLLRPHMMRLRNKLDLCPPFAHRIVNVRGNGYMFT